MEMVDTGIPGEEQFLAAIPHFREPSDVRNLGGPEGLPGKYKVTFVLSRPGFPLEGEHERKFSEQLQGDSHLAITGSRAASSEDSAIDYIEMEGNTRDGFFKFKGYPNTKGFLGKIESQPFEADSFGEAQQKAHRAVSPFLSDWSIHLDIPLHIYRIEATELRTLGKVINFVVPSWEVPWSVAPTANLRAEYRGYASLYREALNSSSRVYRFLCLYKIIEGVLARRRRLGEEARNKDERFSRPEESIPSKSEEFTPWLNSIFSVRPDWDEITLESIFRKEALGKRIKYVVDGELHQLRTDIAHALLSESGELTLSVDEALHIERINKWLPLTRCIARRMLKNEFPDEFLSHIKED